MSPAPVSMTTQSAKMFLFWSTSLLLQNLVLVTCTTQQIDCLKQCECSLSRDINGGEVIKMQCNTMEKDENSDIQEYNHGDNRSYIDGFSNVTSLPPADYEVAKKTLQIQVTLGQLSLYLVIRGDTIPRDLCSLSDVTHLYINNSQISQASIDLECLDQVTNLHVAHCGVFEIKTWLLPPHVNTIDLSYNNISNFTDIPPMTFLTHLGLSHNMMTHINEEAFRDILSLRHLTLSYNNLTYLPRGMFSNSLDLYHLDLSRNMLGEIPFVTYLYNLTYLDLSFNKLSSLGLNEVSETFAEMSTQGHQNDLENATDPDPGQIKMTSSLGNTEYSDQPSGNPVPLWPSSLRMLNLSHNFLTILPPGALACQLSSLQNLDLSYNALIQLTSFSISGLYSLRVLNLSHNALSQLGTDTFEENPQDTCDVRELEDDVTDVHEVTDKRDVTTRVWPALHTLDVSHNALRGLNMSSSQHALVNLRVLNLHDNLLTRLPPYAIESLHALRRVDLHNNLIDWLDVGTFTNPRIQVVDLSGNQLTRLISMAFLYTPSVKLIDLSHNKLSYIYTYAFYRTCKRAHTITIRLHDNYLQSDVITTLLQTFRHLDHTECTAHIDLRHNQLRDLFSSSTQVMTSKIQQGVMTYFSTWSHVTFDLGYNTFSCDCDLKADVELMYSVAKLLEDVTVINLVDDFDNLTCHEPVFSRDESVSEVIDGLSCPVHDHCPVGCDCVQRSYSHLVEVDCTNNNFTDLPLHLPLSPLLLNMSYNDVTSFSSPSYSDIWRVKILDLSHNNLRSIDAPIWRNLSLHVTSLYLHDNELTELEQPLSDSVLHEITLKGNPIHCRCSNLWLHSLLNNSLLITDADAVICSDGQPLAEGVAECRRIMRHTSHVKVTWGTSGTVAIAIIIPLVLSLGFIIGYRLLSRSTFCTRRSKWYKVHVEEDRKCDVAVLCEVTDISWTRNTLLPALTDGSRTYTVTLGKLFTGDSPNDVIRDAQRGSRAVVVVTSSQSLGQADACWEGLLMELLLVDTGSVYLMFSGEVCSQSLPPACRDDITSQVTCLSGSSEWGLQRLLYLLPPPSPNGPVHLPTVCAELSEMTEKRTHQLE